MESCETNDIFNQLCISNGIDVKDDLPSLMKIEKLEVFFSGFPRIVGLSYFTNLSILIIIDQPIKVIENLDSCINLVSLWICECEISVIEGLDQCGQIRHLYLYDNQIQKIKNLDSLRLLETLWLNNNKIKTIEGLQELLILDDLNLAGNEIKSIGTTLKSNISIEKLDLSGNALDDLNDVLNLTKLPKLKRLSINGPDYIPNPVFFKTNYFLFMLYHFPNLKTLDSYDVNSSYLKDFVVSIVEKKKLYYSMKIKTLERNTSFCISQLRSEMTNICEEFNQNLISISYVLKFMQSEFREKINNDFNYHSHWETEMVLLKSEITNIERELDLRKSELEFYLNKQVKEQSDNKDLLQMELSSCGNFRFELSSDKLWACLCNDLLSSRFCKYEYPNLDISGVKIHNVMKVKNIYKEKQYSKSIHNTLADQDCDFDSAIYGTKCQDYLFYYPRQKDLPLVSYLKILYSSDNSEEIRLTNCVSIGNIGQTDSSTQHRDFVLYGRVMLVKAFIKLAKFAADYSDISETERHKIVYKTNVTSQNAIGKCGCMGNKFIWYFPNNTLLLPEYIVDFEYVQDKYRSSMYSVYHGNRKKSSLKVSNSLECEEDINNMRKQIDFDNNIKLKSAFFTDLISSSNVSQITILNLSNCHLKSVTNLSLFENLEELLMPFNNFITLKDISNPKLKVLDVSFNKIQSLEDMNSLLSLRHLDLQNNLLTKVGDELSFLHKHVPNLIFLNIKCNLFQKNEQDLRVRIVSQLKYLKVLDENEVTDDEYKLALDLLLKSRISETAIAEFGRIDTVKPRTLSVDNVANIMSKLSNSKITFPINDYSKLLRITSLCLDDQSISKISNIDRLENLRFLSLCNNFISKIEGLDSCLHLEELILDNNSIVKVENLHRLQKLKKLSLNENFLISLSNLQSLISLTILSVYTNKIISLTGLESCQNLCELYSANNLISENSEISNLKNLSNLIILDLFHNPVTKSNQNYRLHVIFHLRNIKVVDGVCVDNSEIAQSKEMLGGRLNIDFLRERIGHESFDCISELDLSNCLIKSVDLTPVDKLKTLRSLNLENNNLTSFSGLISLNRLKVLCLNSNSVESVLPRFSKANVYPVSDGNKKVDLRSLEVLHLGYNNIKNLSTLGLNEIPSLKALFLQGNDIATIEGIENLIELKEIILDQNRIKSISENSFVNNTNLREVHLEDNRLKSLANIYHLKHLKRLYLANNKISDTRDLELFQLLDSLIDVSLFGNPITRRHQHRICLIHMVPSLLMIDGVEITEEERCKYDLDENSENSLLPGILSNQQNKLQAFKTSPTIYSSADMAKSDYQKNEFSIKKRGSNNNTNTMCSFTGKGNSVQLVANSKAVYFYDPIGQSDCIPRLYLNKRK